MILPASLGDFLRNPPKSPPFVCKPLLPRTGIMVIHGQTKVHKSFLALNIAYQLAEGRDVLGKWAVQGGPKRVLLIEQECGSDEMYDRLSKLHNAMCGIYADTNLFIISQDPRIKLDDPTGQGIDIFRKRIDEVRPNVVVLDPWGWFFNADDNDNHLMRRILHTLDEEQHKEGKEFCSILVAHDAKRNDFKSGAHETNSIKGASVLSEYPGTIIGVEKLGVDKKDKPAERKLFLTLRHGKEEDPFVLVFDGDTATFKTVS